MRTGTGTGHRAAGTDGDGQPAQAGWVLLKVFLSWPGLAAPTRSSSNPVLVANDRLRVILERAGGPRGAHPLRSAEPALY